MTQGMSTPAIGLNNNQSAYDHIFDATGQQRAHARFDVGLFVPSGDAHAEPGGWRILGCRAA